MDGPRGSYSEVKTCSPMDSIGESVARGCQILTHPNKYARALLLGRDREDPFFQLLTYHLQHAPKLGPLILSKLRLMQIAITSY